MRWSRRRVLGGLGALGGAVVAGCGKDGSGKGGKETGGREAGPRDPEPDPWEAPGEEDADAFAWGVVAGDATPDGVILSVRTTEEAVALVLMRADGSSWVEVDTGAAPEVVDGVAQVELAGLDPDTAWSYAFYAPDGSWRSPVGRFRTALATGGWRRIAFGATSCLGGNEPWPTLSLAAAERLDFVLLLGDTVYADGAVSKEEYRAFWKAALATEGLRDLTASTSVVATWDDHEVLNDFAGADADPVQVADALAAFREALPQRRGPGGTGIWRLLSWGDVLDLVVLDSRGEREPAAGRYLSPEQMAWLEDTLSASTARFKVILNSVPITDYSPMFGDAFAFDRWQGFPEDRTRILSFVRDNDISGVLWVTGDFHMSGVYRVDPPGSGGPGEDQWEVMAGCAGSTLNITAELWTPDEQFTVIFAQWNIALFDVDPDAGTMRVRFIGDDGAIIDEVEVVP